MTLSDWMAEKHGRASALARHCGVTPQAMVKWRREGVPPDRMRAVRDFTGGEVSLEDMVPDPNGSAPRPVKNKAHPLVGMYFHTFHQDGNVQYQGHILAVDGEVALAQMFSWIDGFETNVMPFQKSFLYSPQCKLYAGEKEWRDWADNRPGRPSELHGGRP